MKVYIVILLIGVVFARQKTCVRNARYTKCGTACPLTCENVDNPPNFCAAVCIQGCQCEEGFVRSRDLGCVKPEECPKSSIQPPATVVIKDEQGEPLESLAGPYDEGSSLFLACEAKGGHSATFVTWWSKDVLIDDTFSATSEGSVINELVISKLQRSDFMKELTCRAFSLNSTQFMNATVKIDMNNNVCGENERYNECGTPCPVTCDTYDVSDLMCAQLCDEGCECEDGFVRRDDGKCVRPEQCPQKEKKNPLNCADCPDIGPCDASLLRFYYDSEEERCKEFMFGGCGGNTNNFETEEVCQATCGNMS